MLAGRLAHRFCEVETETSYDVCLTIDEEVQRGSFFKLVFSGSYEHFPKNSVKLLADISEKKNEKQGPLLNV